MQTTIAAHYIFVDGFAEAGTPENVVARLEGTNDGGKAFLLMAHYDSVSTAPGASDDGAGVASMLETLRALKAGPPLKNDVIFLFTDGEERGLLGARAFVDSHPWAEDVGVVLNLEARGNTGPAIHGPTPTTRTAGLSGSSRRLPLTPSRLRTLPPSTSSPAAAPI